MNAGAESGDLVGGPHAVLALLDADEPRASRIWVQKAPRSGRLAEIVDAARRAGVPFDLVERAWLDRRAGGLRHQGVLAQVRPVVLADEAGLLAHIDASLGADSGRVLLLVLDEIQDARNLGACLRSADAAGVTAIVLPKRRSAPLNAAASKAAAGALEQLFIAEVTNLTRTLKALKERGVWVFGAAADGAQRFDQADFSAPTALVLGSEGKGVRRLVREQCDALVSLPMAGSVASLNVSVATGILLFEVVRQRLD
ncbi:MAG: 23S rRNA (guanosine(2251)-2'-O)-methyltransferase RlmB [Pseudomonadota bacterium]